MMNIQQGISNVEDIYPYRPGREFDPFVIDTSSAMPMTTSSDAMGAG